MDSEELNDELSIILRKLFYPSGGLNRLILLNIYFSFCYKGIILYTMYQEGSQNPIKL